MFELLATIAMCVIAVKCGDDSDSSDRSFTPKNTTTAEYNYHGIFGRFRFQYYYSPQKGYRAYILESPNYRDRSVTSPATHRIHEGSKYYICWDKPIRNYSVLKANCPWNIESSASKAAIPAFAAVEVKVFSSRKSIAPCSERNVPMTLLFILTIRRSRSA